MAGVTLDTGVFIALERRKRRALALWAEWTRTATTVTVPAVVIAEWWRDRQWDAARWLAGVDVEPVDESLARIAGEALGELRLGREHTIDAIVMASVGPAWGHRAHGGLRGHGAAGEAVPGGARVERVAGEAGSDFFAIALASGRSAPVKCHETLSAIKQRATVRDPGRSVLGGGLQSER